MTFLGIFAADMSHQRFLSIYREYADDLLSYGTGLGFGKEDIEDTLQDVIVNLYRNDPQLANVRNVKVYLFTALKNRLLNTTRRQRMDSLDDGEGHFDVSVSISDVLEDEEEQLRVKRKVEQGLALLTPRQREAVYLRYIQELDYDDIAHLLQMTKPSVRNLVSRGLLEMRQQLAAK